MDRPFVYLLSGIFVGITVCILFIYCSIFVASIITLLYLLIIYKNTNYKLMIVILGYLILGIISFNLYFNTNLPKNIIKVRLTEDKGYYAVAEYYGKKVKLLNINDEFEIGKKYLIEGNFERIPIYYKGILGNFMVKNLKELDNDFIGITYDIKKELFEKFSKKLGNYNTSILMGVCYGDSSYISYDDMEAFNVLGISHVISVSGLHVSLIYGALSSVLGCGMSIFLLLGYVIFTGAKAATIRAFIMIVILVLANRIRKNYDDISALAFAAFILLLLKPYYILDAGYCLSFLGMLGIYLLYKKLRRKLYRLPKVLNESLSLTTAASAFTLPYVIFIFKTFTIGGIISNLLVIPFYTFVVVIGNIALFVYKIQPIFDFLCTILISIFSIINGAQDFLLSMLPNPLSISYLEGMVLVFLYPIYLLIKRGYKSLVYMPLALYLLVIVNYYKIFPQISFINSGEHNIISVRYKYNTFLISPQKVKLSKIYENIKVDKIYDELENNKEIALDDNYCLKIYREDKELILFLYNNNNSIVFVQKDLEKDKGKSLNQEHNKKYSLESVATFVDSGIKDYIDNKTYTRSSNPPYDIITVVKNKDIHGKGRYIKSFTIINGIAYDTYVH